MIEFAVLCPQTGFDVSQTFAISELGKRHAQILVETGKLLDLEIATVTSYALMKDMERQVLHYLRENDFADVHGSAPRELSREFDWTSWKFSSR